MTKFLHTAATAAYLLCVVLATAAFALMIPLIVAGHQLARRVSMGHTLRFLNWLYGLFLVRLSRPLIRIVSIGQENLPQNTSCVVVVNHRSTADIFFAPFFTPENTVVFVRSWPFRIWFLSWFMKLAGYVDIEKTDVRDFVAGRGREFLHDRASFLFFPEGHRSRDGRLQVFRSGAFLLAAELDIPVVPVCMAGTEQFLPMKDHRVRRATVRLEILPPVHPSQFPEERRAIKLKKHVESAIREHLDREASAAAECGVPGEITLNSALKSN